MTLRWPGSGVRGLIGPLERLVPPAPSPGTCDSGGGGAVMAGTTSPGLDMRVLSERQQNYRGEASMHFGSSRAGQGISKY